jgi:hypothetical protein
MNSSQIGFANPNRRPGRILGRMRTRGLSGLAAYTATQIQAQAELLAGYQQDLQDDQQALADDLASGATLGDGSGTIEADNAAIATDQSDIAAAQSLLQSMQASATGMTPATVASSLNPSTVAALQAVNPNVLNASTLTQLIQQLTAAAANANLTSVQKQALSNQLATYQGGLFSTANMPFLMIGIAAIFFFASKK